MTRVLRGGFPVFERTFGTGKDRAVLLHCSLANSKAWAGCAAQLSDDLTMIAPDMPGHGGSADWDRRGDIGEQIVAIADDCLGDRAHLVGHSYGAVIALWLASQRPDAVSSLTLIEPVLFAAAKDSDPAAYATYLTVSATFGAAMKREDWEASARAFHRVWGDGRKWEALSDKERSGFVSRMHFIAETEGMLLNDTAGVLTPGRIERITCPTLLIRGGESPAIISAVHATLARRIAGAQDVVVPHANHMVPITHATEVAAQISKLVGVA